MIDCALVVDGEVVGRYSISPLPGCAAVGVFHGVQIYPEFRGKGYASKGLAERLRTAKELKYQVVLATMVDTNIKEEHVLRKFGFQQISAFFNPKTQNVVYMWKKDLDPNRTYEELYGE